MKVRGVLFTVVAYKKIYGQPHFHLDPANVNVTVDADAMLSQPTVESDRELSELDEDSVLPPSPSRPTGAPKKRRICGAAKPGQKAYSSAVDAGRSGHSKRTCREPINGAA